MILSERNVEGLKKYSYTYNFDKSYLVGSALNSSFNGKSNIDFLVKFKSMELSEYFENYITLKENLKNLFEREVDLLKEQTLKNPIPINSITKFKQLIFG